MTKKQQKRLEELENEAISRYLNKTDFDISEWLDESEVKEYCELYNMQFDEKNCVCGEHTEWQ